MPASRSQILGDWLLCRYRCKHVYGKVSDMTKEQLLAHLKSLDKTTIGQEDVRKWTILKVLFDMFVWEDVHSV